MYDSIVVAIPRHIVYDCLVGVSWAVEPGLKAVETSNAVLSSIISKYIVAKSTSVCYIFTKSQFKDLSIYLSIFNMSKLTAV